jgi:hypothetical protein
MWVATITCMPPEEKPYLYRCPHCSALFHDRETAKKHIREKHYSTMLSKADSAASFFNWYYHTRK